MTTRLLLAVLSSIGIGTSLNLQAKMAVPPTPSSNTNISNVRGTGYTCTQTTCNDWSGCSMWSDPPGSDMTDDWLGRVDIQSFPRSQCRNDYSPFTGNSCNNFANVICKQKDYYLNGICPNGGTYVYTGIEYKNVCGIAP
jgi:hypothetical protein